MTLNILAYYLKRVLERANELAQVVQHLVLVVQPGAQLFDNAVFHVGECVFGVGLELVDVGVLGIDVFINVVF